MSDKCGCRVTPAGPDMRGDGRMLYEINYCPLHAAAPKMLTALKSVLWAEVVHVDLTLVRAAIAKAEPQNSSSDAPINSNKTTEAK